MSSEVIEVPQQTGDITTTPAERGVAQFEQYRALQSALDRLMPNEIMEIGYGEKRKKFRKKGYWRAVARGFRLQTEIVKEERVESGTDWGYLFVVRATAPNGDHSDGDGSCMASEKIVYAWENGRRTNNPDPAKTRENQTVHNVRAHALTRAKNRAISDLVGFGEVSAEEIRYDDDEPHPVRRAPEKAQARPGKRQEPQPTADREGAWLDEMVGFGSKETMMGGLGKVIPKALKWSELIDGAGKDGRRYGWLANSLEWCRAQETPGAVVRLFMERAPKAMALIEQADASA